MKTIHSFIALAIATSFSVAYAGPKVETLPSGVIVEHVKPGSGAQPTANDRVKVNYRGTLTNGTEFDSSYKRNQPISFPLKGVIPCWTEGVQMMKVGETAKLTCPAKTAYGAASPSPLIPPNSTLVFEIELLGINQ
jgi:FKBP-type peptidyl-prolyl cis-trans isomerase FkpA